jgi:hypothetical protein
MLDIGRWFCYRHHPTVVGVSIDRYSIELLTQRDAARFEPRKMLLTNRLQSAR